MFEFVFFFYQFHEIIINCSRMRFFFIVYSCRLQNKEIHNWIYWHHAEVVYYWKHTLLNFTLFRLLTMFMFNFCEIHSKLEISYSCILQLWGCHPKQRYRNFGSPSLGFIISRWLIGICFYFLLLAQIFTCVSKFLSTRKARIIVYIIWMIVCIIWMWLWLKLFK